jgi:ubiquinol-cytochrome c reductase cytochrome b subunit
MPRLGDWLEERVGWRGMLRSALDEPVLGGASFAYVFGSVLTFCLVLQMVTGVFLAMYYSPSATDAWASVAYLESEVTLGWFVRGLHHHGASAMVIVAGLHMLQVALFGAYKRPREVNWIVGVAMLGLILAFALTGYLLPWDQTGYWATQVATGIAGATPIAGDAMKQVVQGGNEYGNLTLTRFFAIHVFILPGAMIGLLALHLVLFRRHGVTPGWWKKGDALAGRAQPFWPDQLLRDVVAMAALFAALVVYNVKEHGAGLDGPADPSSNFDARPEWYFRALFQALKYFQGPLETAVALGAPVVVGGILLALPFIDRGPDTDPRRRVLPLALLSAVLAGGGALTAISMIEDARDEQYRKGLEDAEARGKHAMALARQHGVPAAGGLAVYATEPGFRARELWAARCAGCHEGDERKGPEIGPGFGSRDHLREFLKDPSGERFFGVTQIQGMKPVSQEGRDLDALVELIYAESGAPDVDPALVARGKELFDGDGGCDSCHSLEPDGQGDVGPALHGHGSAAYWSALIALPGHPRFFGDKSEMPPQYDELGPDDRRELGAFIAGLRELAWPARPEAKKGVYDGDDGAEEAGSDGERPTPE